MVQISMSFPGDSVVKTAYKCRRCKRCGFNLWVSKITWRRKCQITSILAWEISWIEEPGEKVLFVPSMGLQRDMTL